MDVTAVVQLARLVFPRLDVSPFHCVIDSEALPIASGSPFLFFGARRSIAVQRELRGFALVLIFASGQVHKVCGQSSIMDGSPYLYEHPCFGVDLGVR